MEPVENPFFVDSPLPLGMPPFDRIENRHFAPAYERGMAEQRAEVERIASSSEAPTFDNSSARADCSAASGRRSPI